MFCNKLPVSIRKYAATALVVSAVMVCSAVPDASAAGAWGYDTGIYDFSEAHGGEAVEEFRHAVALLAHGSTRQGIRRLRRLIRRHPEADWIGAAHYHLGLGYFERGRYENAFERFGEFIPHAERIEDVRTAQELQYECAVRTGKDDPEKARPLFDTLADSAHDRSLAARSRWAAANAFYSGGKYFHALDAYYDFIDHHSAHEKVPEAWFRVSRCHYILTLRIGRGLENFRVAESALGSYLSYFPEHERREEAEQMLEDIRRRRADRIASVADYFIRVRRDPHAALDYLRDIEREFEGTEPAVQAKERIAEIERELDTPAPGWYKMMPLEGITGRQTP